MKINVYHIEHSSGVQKDSEGVRKTPNHNCFEYAAVSSPNSDTDLLRILSQVTVAGMGITSDLLNRTDGKMKERNNVKPFD